MRTHHLAQNAFADGARTARESVGRQWCAVLRITYRIEHDTTGRTDRVGERRVPHLGPIPKTRVRDDRIPEPRDERAVGHGSAKRHRPVAQVHAEYDPSG